MGEKSIFESAGSVVWVSPYFRASIQEFSLYLSSIQSWSHTRLLATHISSIMSPTPNNILQFGPHYPSTLAIQMSILRQAILVLAVGAYLFAWMKQWDLYNPHTQRHYLINCYKSIGLKARAYCFHRAPPSWSWRRLSTVHAYRGDSVSPPPCNIIIRKHGMYLQSQITGMAPR